MFEDMQNVDSLEKYLKLVLKTETVICRIFSIFLGHHAYYSYNLLDLQLGDVCYEDIPRVRLDRVRRPAKALWDGPPTLAEENEDSDSCVGGSGGMSGINDIVLNTTLYSELGK